MLAAEVADSIAAFEQIAAALVGSSGAGVEVADMKAWEASDMSAWGAGEHHQRVQQYFLISSSPGDEDGGLLPLQ